MCVCLCEVYSGKGKDLVRENNPHLESYKSFRASKGKGHMVRELAVSTLSHILNELDLNPGVESGSELEPWQGETI